VEEITERNKEGQPALVGTVSIEKSERLSALLKKKGVKHTVLNAKYHELEAEIVAQAGRKGATTIATNMAGRGTDILLGGNPDFLAKKEFNVQTDLPQEEREKRSKELKAQCEKEKEEVIRLGGLHIIGTERHEARRIDNQLRGRSGRQGDPGSSRFYLSLEDDLMRIFGSERIANLMDKLGMEEGTPIEHRMVTRAIEGAQKKVETHNFDIRKHLLEFDDVMNQQRGVIYGQRREILQGERLTEILFDMIEDLLDDMLAIYCSKDIYPEEWDITALNEAFSRMFSVGIHEGEIDFANIGLEGLREALLEKVRKAYSDKEGEFGSEVMRRIEKVVLLQVVDTQWKDHLLAMDHLKEGIGLRGYGQKDPLVEYKREGFEMFSDMITRIKSEAVERLFKIQLVKEDPIPQRRPVMPQSIRLNRGESSAPRPVQKSEQKVGRNDPCPCGSGKKYKKCHGA